MNSYECSSFHLRHELHDSELLGTPRRFVRVKVEALPLNQKVKRPLLVGAVGLVPEPRGWIG